MTALLTVVGVVLLIGAPLPLFLAWRLRHHGVPTVGEITRIWNSIGASSWRVGFNFRDRRGRMVQDDFGVMSFDRAFYHPGDKLTVVYDPAFTFNHARHLGPRLTAQSMLATAMMLAVGAALIATAIGLGTVTS